MINQLLKILDVIGTPFSMAGSFIFGMMDPSTKEWFQNPLIKAMVGAGVVLGGIFCWVVWPMFTGKKRKTRKRKSRKRKTTRRRKRK